MGNREEFEKIERVKDILSEYDWFFDFHSNQYVLESHSGDIGCLQASSYLDGLWYMWQARVPEGYVVVPKEPTPKMIDVGMDGFCFPLDNGSFSNHDLISAYRAMLEAVEK